LHFPDWELFLGIFFVFPKSGIIFCIFCIS
jgi:hypothetical protein